MQIESDPQAWALPLPHKEAAGLLAMLRAGESPEPLRELIAISPAEEKELRAFAAEYRELAQHIERVITFRKAVLAEFDRRCADYRPQLCPPRPVSRRVSYPKPPTALTAA